MLNYKTEAKSRTCDSCKISYEEEIIIVNGCEVGANAPTLCVTCLDGHKRSIDKREAKQRAQRLFNELIQRDERDVDIKHPSFNSDLLAAMKLWWENKNGKISIGVIGSTGRCKTKCFALLAQRMLHDGHSVGWCNASEMNEAFKAKADRNFSDQAKRRRQEAFWKMDKWKNVKHFIIDDLGKGGLSKETQQGIYEIVNHRWARALPIHWSANTNPIKMFSSLPEDIAEPLARRFTEKTKIINLKA